MKRALLTLFSLLLMIGAAIVAGSSYRDGTKIGSIQGTTYIDTRQKASTQYHYSVSAYDAAGNDSGQAIQVAMTTLVSETVGADAKPFVPLHTYFVSPTGDDARDGKTPATAWRLQFWGLRRSQTALRCCP